MFTVLCLFIACSMNEGFAYTANLISKYIELIVYSHQHGLPKSSQFANFTHVDICALFQVFPYWGKVC